MQRRKGREMKLTPWTKAHRFGDSNVQGHNPLCVLRPGAFALKFSNLTASLRLRRVGFGSRQLTGVRVAGERRVATLVQFRPFFPLLRREDLADFFADPLEFIAHLRRDHFPERSGPLAALIHDFDHLVVLLGSQIQLPVQLSQEFRALHLQLRERRKRHFVGRHQLGLPGQGKPPPKPARCE